MFKLFGVENSKNQKKKYPSSSSTNSNNLKKYKSQNHFSRDFLPIFATHNHKSMPYIYHNNNLFKKKNWPAKTSILQFESIIWSTLVDFTPAKMNNTAETFSYPFRVAFCVWLMTKKTLKESQFLDCFCFVIA